MTEEQHEDVGIVKEVAGNMFSVEVERGGGCKSCSMQGFCFKKNEPVQFLLSSDLPLEVNDRVELEIAPEGRVMASLMIFGIPILALFVGYYVSAAWLTELGAILSSFALMALSIFLVRWLDKRLGGKLKVSIKRKL